MPPQRKAKPDKTKEAEPPKHGSEGRYKLGTREIDNPYDVGPDRITVQVNVKHDAIESLFDRKRINAAQKQAGDRIRRLYERMQGAGARGVDLQAVRVDGGQAARSQSLDQLEAIETLGKLAAVLGIIVYPLLIRCAGQGMDMRQTADDFYGGRATRSQLDFVSQSVQAGLGEAAVFFRLQSPSRAPSARVAHLCPVKRVSDSGGKKGD